jgi:hypothetical protein
MNDLLPLNKVYARIEIEVELGELSSNGTMLDLLGLSSSVRKHLESLPMTGPQMRVVGVSPLTKEWEVEAQLRNPRPFIDPSQNEVPQ